MTQEDLIKEIEEFIIDDSYLSEMAARIVELEAEFRKEAEQKAVSNEWLNYEV